MTITERLVLGESNLAFVRRVAGAGELPLEELRPSEGLMLGPLCAWGFLVRDGYAVKVTPKGREEAIR